MHVHVYTISVAVCLTLPGSHFQWLLRRSTSDLAPTDPRHHWLSDAEFNSFPRPVSKNSDHWQEHHRNITYKKQKERKQQAYNFLGMVQKITSIQVPHKTSKGTIRLCFSLSLSLSLSSLQVLDPSVPELELRGKLTKHSRFTEIALPLNNKHFCIPTVPKS